jgi:hypothetical protein
VSNAARLKNPYRTRLWHRGQWLDLGHFQSKEKARAARELASKLLQRDPLKIDTIRESVHNKLFFEELQAIT